MYLILGLPILILLVILQSSVVSRVNLSNGSIDLVLISLIALGTQRGSRRTIYWFILGGFLLGSVSVIRFMHPLIPYFIVGVMVEYLKRRVWKVPLLLMALLSFLGTMLVHAFAYISIYLTQVQLPLITSFLQVTLPSIALNIVVGIPIYLFVHDWYNGLVPMEEE